MTTILEAGSTQCYGLLYAVWGQLAQVGEMNNATASGEVNLIQQLIQAFILGIVQGITEFLPISSTAHLQVFTKALGWELLGQKAFLATIQFGSVIAVLLYFWKDITQILTGGWAAFQQKDWRRDEWQLLVGIAVGTLPALVGGFLLKKALNDENSVINSMTTIAIDSIVMAILLGVAEKFGKRKRDFQDLKIRDGLLIGLGQMLSLAPGVSRSGSTLTTALFLGLKRETAARFSFLLGIPTLMIATLYEFVKEALGKIDLVVVTFGTFSAFVFSYISIAWLLRYLQTHNNFVFVWYRLAFGATILGAIATGLLKNT
ncbi:undecaprenol kinase [Scytonema sp. HK-05]|uniref:undecaprenyl-diphosphate phosphatase n=1 Tax=Scytonema sp. HK-05 TaxID=1137095 RepID=UPI0009376BD9|nr:undecaprenyl-diphosphate phosphatase [Scytonema sp. HK-05]OKH59791.1 undecaprenyl-diphosphatase [Scytonema sp. HK-05]BAY43141.1 undecaprenol kinase [Scytonema sp. HK-05]